jgi:hypothetical protein
MRPASSQTLIAAICCKGAASDSVHQNGAACGRSSPTDKNAPLRYVTKERTGVPVVSVLASMLAVRLVWTLYRCSLLSP